MSTLAGVIVGFAAGIIVTLIVEHSLFKKKAVGKPGGSSWKDDDPDDPNNAGLK